MKIDKILILVLIGILLTFSSCEDYLTKEPRLEQTKELTLSSYDGMMKAASAMYSVLYDDFYFSRDLYVIADLKGGNSKISPITSGRFVQEYLWSNTPTNSNFMWTRGYDAIARANNIINALEGFEEPGIDEADLIAVEAEAKFIRGMAYFDMARLYCPSYLEGADNPYGLPIVLVTEISEPARNTLGETYAQVISDLEFAAENLPSSPLHEGTDPKGWATQNAALALLARAHLYMQDWQDAADYATEVIESGDYELYTPEEYTTWDSGGVWGVDAAPEIIFEIFGDEGNAWHPNWNTITYIMSPDGYGDVGASMDVINLFEEDDVRLGLFTNTPAYPNDYWSLKYPGKGGNLRIDNIPVIRLSEMYLIRAEATLKGASTGVSAAADLNAIRTQRNASELSSATLEDVYNERRRELCFEGHQMFDLKRTGRSLERTDFDGAINQNVPYPDYRWAFPIPIEETDANQNMVQNPGYTSSDN